MCKCSAKLQNGSWCTNKICTDINPYCFKYHITDEKFCSDLTDNNIFCKIHLDTYLQDMFLENKIYTKNDTDTFIRCNSCKVYKDSLNFIEFNSCLKCRSRIKPTKIIDLCIFDNCKYEQIKYKNNQEPNNCLHKLYLDYCGKHQLKGWLNELKDNNLKPCSQYNHNGCRTELSKDDKYNSCLECRLKSRETDKARHHDKIQIAQTYNNHISNIKMCTKCLKEYNLDQYIRSGYSQLTDHCLNCREKQQIIETNRVERVRDYKEYENRLEVKERRRLYRKYLKEHEPEKYKMYSILHRLRLREILGEEKYLRLMADRMKKYLDRNPDKRLQLNEFKKKSLKVIVSNYKRSANKRELDYHLSDEETKLMIQNECFYCKDINEEGYLNGIDRKDNNIGYEVDNCVTCCKICNISKKKMNVDEFIGKVHHILSYLGLIKERYNYGELFKDHINIYYRDYENRANKKLIKNYNFSFDMTKEQFMIITSIDCYLCGKEQSDTHLNGVDRIDNKFGYEFGNILSCCGDCNYIKNEFNIYDLLIKFNQIYLKRVLSNEEKQIQNWKIEVYINNKIKEVSDNINEHISDVAGMIFDSYYYDKSNDFNENTIEI